MIPQRLEGGYRLVEEYLMEDLEKFKNHPRMSVFYNKGTKCVVPGCDHEGIHLFLVEEINSKSKVKHINLYSSTFRLMTVDHILPKSKGGSMRLDNLQPMCAGHNQLRGNMPYERFLAGERLKVINWKVNRMDRNCVEGYFNKKLIFIIEIPNTLTDLREMYSGVKALPTYYKVDSQKEGRGVASDLLNEIVNSTITLLEEKNVSKNEKNFNNSNTTS